MNKNKNIKDIIIAIVIPLLVGGVSTLLTMKGMDKFKELNQPFLSPPTWLFPIVWTILYIMMGIASYLIYKNKNVFFYEEREKTLLLYVAQLILNFFWSIIFFNMQQFVFAFFWLLLLWVFVLLLIINSKKVNKTAYYLLIPYILWLTFAGYLNIMVAILH